MSKIGQYFMTLPYEDESGICDDPYYQLWADEQDKEDQKAQDEENNNGFK